MQVNPFEINGHQVLAANRLTYVAEIAGSRRRLLGGLNLRNSE